MKQDKISFDELYYLVNEKNDDAEVMLYNEVEKYLQWLCYAKSNDFLRQEDIMSYGWQGYIEAFKGYDETNTTTFKSFLQHCVKRRLIDVQRKRNKQSLKGHMSGLLMSEEKVQYAVEIRNTQTLHDMRLCFRHFWHCLEVDEKMLFELYLKGETPKALALRYETTESIMYKRIRTVKEKLKAALDGKRVIS